MALIKKKKEKPINPNKRPMFVPDELFPSEKVREMNKKALQLLSKRGF